MLLPILLIAGAGIAVYAYTQSQSSSGSSKVNGSSNSWVQSAMPGIIMRPDCSEIKVQTPQAVPQEFANQFISTALGGTLSDFVQVWRSGTGCTAITDNSVMINESGERTTVSQLYLMIRSDHRTPNPGRRATYFW